MSLLEVRTKFRQLSGRYDLVNSDYSDNGADFFIKAGQRFIERLFGFPLAAARLFRNPAEGEFYLNFTGCRAVQEVWAYDSDGKWQLEKKSIQDMRALLTKPSEADSGAPLYYAPNVLRLAEHIRDAVAGDESDIGDTQLASVYKYQGIIFYPPAESGITLEVLGLFSSLELCNDGDCNFWTEMHPDVLISATFYSIESMNRNTQGANDWLATLTRQLEGIDKDMVEEDIAERDQMEG